MFAQRPEPAGRWGNWSDGAEHSLVFRIYADEPTVRYATASLGKNCRQKTVLYFRRQAGGSGRLYVMSIRRQASGLTSVVRALAKTLDESGISYRTLVPLRTRVIVYVVDLTNELQAKVESAARRLYTSFVIDRNWRIHRQRHVRDRAQEVFALRSSHTNRFIHSAVVADKPNRYSERFRIGAPRGPEGPIIKKPCP